MVSLFTAGHALLVRCFGARGRPIERFVASAVFAVAVPIAVVVVLGRARVLTPRATLLTTIGIALAAWAAAGARGRETTRRDLGAALAMVRSALFGGTWSIGAWIGVVGLSLATVATWLLPVWAWDALGYHLPLVHDALLTGSLRVVPTHVPYVNAYPHAVDLYFVWWRALLPDDTWIELAQLPFALLAVLATTALAARAGVSPGRALGWSLPFLAIPAVTLQLATNYVDIAYGALLVASVSFFFRRPFEPGDALLAGIALALFLATKPSAPLPFALLAAAALFHHRGRQRRVVLVLSVACSLGALTYLENLLRYGNPVWPVRMQLGPLTMPGTAPSTYFFDLGVPEPYRSYGLLRRLFASWYHWPASFVYDMRLGGFGPLVAVVLLPIAVATFLWRRRALRPIRFALLLLVGVSLATPAAFWARYTLAFPLALLVVGALGTAHTRPRVRRATELSVGAFAAVGLVAAAPGLTDGRVSLAELALHPPEQRAALFGGIDGDEADWLDARRLGIGGHAAAYDRSLGLPGRLWDGIGATKIVYVGDLPPEEIAPTLEREQVDTAALGERAARAVARTGVRLEPLFVCSIEPCTVYRIHRKDDSPLTNR